MFISPYHDTGSLPNRAILRTLNSIPSVPMSPISLPSEADL